MGPYTRRIIAARTQLELTNWISSRCLSAPRALRSWVADACFGFCCWTAICARNISLIARSTSNRLSIQVVQIPYIYLSTFSAAYIISSRVIAFIRDLCALPAFWNRKKESSLDFEHESLGSISGGFSILNSISLLGWRLLECQTRI